MSKPYRIFGSEYSPYSVKVRSAFRYKGIPHEWVVRSSENMEEYKRYAKLPLIPLVVTPEDEAWQDSTPIIERLEALRPEPSIHPTDAALAFLSALLEEYADEWGNKPMFHYRWTYPADQEATARGIAETNLPGASEETVRGMAQAIRERMVPRLAFVGSNEATREQIEASYQRQLALLEAHLGERPYLFGGRPAFGDLGLFAQLYESSLDPTPSQLLRERAPAVLAWIQRMLEPKAEGDFEPWSRLAATLEPLLAQEVGGLFLPWSTANAEALAAGRSEFEVQLEGRSFAQQTQKYHARSLAKLKERYAAIQERAALDAILARSGCLRWLQ